MPLTFYYFDFRILGEPIRQLLKISGTPFEDRRITPDEWFEMVYNQLPVLKLEDGTEIAQSAAIARYLAKEKGLLWGSNNLEAAKIDGLIDLYKDYYNEIKPFYYVELGVKQGNADELYTEVFVPAADKFFAHIANTLEKNGQSYLVGSSLSYIDLVVCDHMVTINNIRNDYLKSFPKLLAYQARIQATPALADWIAKRPTNRM